jgi:hypothetical protein
VRRTFTEEPEKKRVLCGGVAYYELHPHPFKWKEKPAELSLSLSCSLPPSACILSLALPRKDYGGGQVKHSIIGLRTTTTEKQKSVQLGTILTAPSHQPRRHLYLPDGAFAEPLFFYLPLPFQISTFHLWLYLSPIHEGT